MSAISRIIQQQDLLEVFQELSALVKNPSAVEVAQDLIRQQFQLTEEEKKKAEDARNQILAYNESIKNLENKNQELAKNESIHRKNVDEFNEHKVSETIRLNELSAQLDAKESDLAKKEQVLIERDKKLSESQTVLEAKQKDHQLCMAKREAEITAKNEAMLVAQELLKTHEETVRQKFDKLKSIID